MKMRMTYCTVQPILIVYYGKHIQATDIDISPSPERIVINRGQPPHLSGDGDRTYPSTE